MSSHDASIDANEATKLLKDILNVGKSHTGSAETASVTTNGSMEKGTTSHVGGFGGAAGENLIDSLFRSCHQQVIHLSGNEEEVCTEVHGKEVLVYASPLDNGASSSKMKIKNIVDYGWEHKYGVGQLICLHFHGTYVAYAIRAATSASGAVRVLNYKTGERALIKGLRGLVRDMAFAQSASELLLAVVDEYGVLYIYEIRDEDGTLIPDRVVQVERPPDAPRSDYHRVVWCAFVPDEGCHGVGDEDASRLLVVTIDDEAEVWNIGTVVREYGRGCLTTDRVRAGLQKIKEHKKPITDAVLAPDGTALATASCDGEVIFFQVSTLGVEKTPRCLHRWVPHNKRPLSCLFFLDNLKTCNQDSQFWKYALTGADNNTELKLWNCESWSCLQTIRFSAPDSDAMLHTPALKVKVDMTANYVVLSDINRKVVYVLHIQQEPLCMQGKAVLLASFPVVLPVLSFVIVEAARCKFKPSTDAEHVDKLENEESAVDREDNICGAADRRVEGAVVRLLWMNTKSLQSCHIVYQTPASCSVTSAMSLSTNSLACTDHLSDLSLDADDLEKLKRENVDLLSFAGMDASEGDGEKTPGFGNGKVLLTPSDFASPTHSGSILSSSAQASQTQPLPLDPAVLASANEPSPAPLMETPPPAAPPMSGLTPLGTLVLDLSRKSDSASPLAIPDDLRPQEEDKSLEAPPRKLSQRSTASSSSQEVAEILAPSALLGHHHAGNSTEEEEEALDAGPEYHYPGETHPPEHEALPALEAHTPKNHVPVEAVWPQALESSQNYPPVTLCLDPLSKLSDSSVDGSSATVDWLRGEVGRVHGSLEVHSQQLNSLTEAIESQAQQLRELQLLLQGLPQHIDKSLSMVQRDSAGEQHAQQVSALSHVEALLQRHEESESLLVEKQTNAVAQAVAAMLGTWLDKAVANQFKDTVMPIVMKNLEGMKETISREIARRLDVTEVTLKDYVSKLVKGKAITDAVVQATSSAAQLHMQATCREVLQNTLVPTVDRICQNLFLQLNDAFQRGTRDYLHQVELHLEKQNNERGMEVVRKVHLTVEHAVQGCVKSLQDALSPPDLQEALGNAIASPLQGLQNTLQQSMAQQFTSQQEKLQTMLREEVKTALRESVAAVDGTAGRSQAVTPIPSSDPVLQQQHIAQLLRQGHYNMAFQQALTAADLNMVVATCDMANPSKLFSRTPCPLQQPVLLSLIQQLCADLATKTDTKLRYLEEAVMNLDRENPVTQEHLGTILQLLSQKLCTFLRSHPTHKLARNAKMLQMATQSLLNS